MISLKFKRIEENSQTNRLNLSELQKILSRMISLKFKRITKNSLPNDFAKI